MKREQAEMYVYCNMNLGIVTDEYEGLDDKDKVLTKQGKPKKKVSRSEMEQALIKKYTSEER